MTFDMGGTSSDVALIDGDIKLTNEGRIGPYPVAVPMVDMHTIGAGGGSIAYLDEGGMLRVGPESAGADPGPRVLQQGRNKTHRHRRQCRVRAIARQCATRWCHAAK